MHRRAVVLGSLPGRRGLAEARLVDTGPPAPRWSLLLPKYWAFNISWHEKPVRRIDSYVAPKGCLTKPGMANFEGSHQGGVGIELAFR